MYRPIYNWRIKGWVFGINESWIIFLAEKFGKCRWLKYWRPVLWVMYKAFYINLFSLQNLVTIIRKNFRWVLRGELITSYSLYNQTMNYIVLISVPTRYQFYTNYFHYFIFQFSFSSPSLCLICVTEIRVP